MNRKIFWIPIMIIVITVIGLLIFHLLLQQVGGPGKSFISLKEITEFMPKNGTYNVIGPISGHNSSALSAYFGRRGSEPAYMPNNITYAWQVTYFTNASKGYQQFLQENVFQTTKPQYIFSQFRTNAFNITNATFDGMMYSYFIENYTAFKFINLVALKGNEVVQLQLRSAHLPNITQLVAIVAGDMP